ncbi:MAG: hypothetical protein BWY50_01628 [Spirochaetes bacterium ADurb.Bin315]|nr:MAG: hypothetical protein BWY50_01628 [Spirochaetes bacterium ADurb.Bin315]HOE89673.1 hypothetical protein [Sphaerochaeta sp.]HPK64226.1 hypothetical protein [Sphaerochaeta sp.]
MKTDGLTLYKKLVCSVLLFVVVLAAPLSADSLIYEAASGKLIGFDVGVTDNPADPGLYDNNPEEVWRKSGFIGRIVYRGPATTFSFNNTGPTATGTQENRFYFTRLLDPDSWKEFFLVVRLKGERHSGARIDFSGVNRVVEHPGGTITMPHGGGIEQVLIDQEGYNANGEKGTYNGFNGYKYKYPYKFVWMDVTLIRTVNSSSLVPNSFYESNITVMAESGTSLSLLLSGEYGEPEDNHSASLSYDPVTGKLIGFDVGVTDSPSNPTAYDGKQNEVWEKPGFIGRVAYTGPPTTLTFTNTGPVATGTQENRFYFTHLSNQGSWKEFFLVVRSKGITHSGTRIDYSEVNKVVEHPLDTITMPYGAGFEEVESGEEGYNIFGTKGTYNGFNGYKYKYPYKYVWMDVTLIRTSNSLSLIPDSFYESNITVTATNGASLTLVLSGEYGDPTGYSPSFYSFGVTKTVTDPFPISDLTGRKTPSQALKVGVVTYTSDNTAANIRFAANAAGTSEVFLFTNENNNNIRFRYYLAFQATKPNRPLETVTPAKQFPTAVQTVYSPIDYPYRTYTWNYLEGDLKIYLPDQVNPASGIYTSTVYCFVTPVH